MKNSLVKWIEIEYVCVYTLMFSLIYNMYIYTYMERADGSELHYAQEWGVVEMEVLDDLESVSEWKC